MPASVVTLSPSDLCHAQGAPERRVRLGGRVVQTTPPRVVLADALGAVSAAFVIPVPLEPGDLVVVEGVWAQGQLVECTLLDRCPAPAPSGSSEFARLAWQGVGPRLKQRAEALQVIREYFHVQGFLEVDTPVRVRAPGLDRHIDPVRADGGWLITSPEYAMKRLLVGGLPRIYQLVHCHRAEEQGPLHEPEFMMLEWYRAFCDLDAVLHDTEHVVARVLEHLTGATSLEVPSGPSVDFRPPFARMTVKEAFRRYAGTDDPVGLAQEDEARYFQILVDRVEPGLARELHPTFLYDYPLTQAMLARPSVADPTTAERFELYFGGVELSNGYAELTDPAENRRRLAEDRRWRVEQRHVHFPLDERLLAALEEGMPPSAGNALGVDRLVALGCKVGSIAEVVSIPSARS